MYIGIFTAVALVGAVVAVWLYDRHKRARENFIATHSTALRNLRQINAKHRFHEVGRFDVTHSYDNQNFFADISPKDFLTYSLVKKETKVKEAMRLAEENQTTYLLYKNEIENTCVWGKYDVEIPFKNKKSLSKMEEKQFWAIFKRPTVRFEITVKLRLTNIRGTYLTHKSKTFGAEDIERILEGLARKSGDFYLDEEIWQSICRVERGRVTNKMRFAIYSRDGYRCRKCGRRTQDLEVDHIFPIAKGGKSDFENLQTLCHRCNKLKSDTVEPGAVDPRAKKHGLKEICPLCGAPLALRRGKNGDFYGCVNYPQCKFTKKA